jgi:hypothetical protein
MRDPQTAVNKKKKNQTSKFSPEQKMYAVDKNWLRHLKTHSFLFCFNTDRCDIPMTSISKTKNGQGLDVTCP